MESLGESEEKNEFQAFLQDCYLFALKKHST